MKSCSSLEILRPRLILGFKVIKFDQIASAHGLPKIRISYDTLPSFRSIVDTTNTPHYGIGKYLSSLINPLTHNDYSVKDTFEAVSQIYSILAELFERGSQYYSLDDVSLFTNVPLNSTINIIFKTVYEEKLLATKLRKSTLKQLIKDTCRNSAFSYLMKYINRFTVFPWDRH